MIGIHANTLISDEYQLNTRLKDKSIHSSILPHYTQRHQKNSYFSSLDRSFVTQIALNRRPRPFKEIRKNSKKPDTIGRRKSCSMCCLMLPILIALILALMSILVSGMVAALRNPTTTTSMRTITTTKTTTTTSSTTTETTAITTSATTTRTTTTTETTTTTARPRYYIRSKMNSFVLDLENGATTQTTRIVASPMQNGTNGNASTQLWFFNSDTSIQSVAAGLVIDINGGIYSTSLHLWPRYSAQNQEWIVNSSYVLCPYSNSAMTIPNLNTTSGVLVVAQTINFSIYQQWDILPG